MLQSIADAGGESGIQCAQSLRKFPVTSGTIAQSGDTMATAVATSTVKVRAGLPGRKYDHVFFSAMALLMLGSVFLGFARTYYLAGMFNAPLPSTIIHIHGAIFSSWILFLLAQTTLVAAGRTDVHRRIGIAGFLLACLMVVVGVWAATNSLARSGGPPGIDPKTFYIIPITDMLIFGVLVFFAYRARFDSAAHKRIIIIATVALMIAAIARWPLPLVHRNPLAAALMSYVFLLMLVAYDLWSTHKVHRATIWASVFLIFVQQIRFPIAQTAAWHAFATWAQNLRL
jgi:FtsH-binding integral membrane protein